MSSSAPFSFALSAQIAHSPLVAFSRLSSPRFDLKRCKFRANRIVRCSLQEDPPPPDPLHSATVAVPSAQSTLKHNKSLKVEMDGSDHRNVELGLGLGLGLGLRLGIQPRSGRRKPLWNRIFFASKKVRSIILLNVLTVIYASDIPVLKEVEAVSEPSFFNMVRFVVSAIPFLPVLFKAFGDCNTRSAGVELGIWVSLGYLSQALGLLTSDASRASFISAFTVIVVPLIDGIFGASIPGLTWVGAISSLMGVALLEASGSPPCIGDILNILSAVFFGIHMLRTEQISRNTSKEKFLPILSFEVCVVALSSVLWFLIKELSSDAPQWSDGSLNLFDLEGMWDLMVSFPWVPAVYTGVFSTVLCLWAEMYAMRDVSATETAIIYGLEPVWGATFAWFLLGERWDSTAWFGAALILCGSLTVQIFGSAPEKSKNAKETKSSPSKLKSSREENYLSFSAIVVDSRKNVTGQIKRQDKL